MHNAIYGINTTLLGAIYEAFGVLEMSRTCMSEASEPARAPVARMSKAQVVEDKIAARGTENHCYDLRLGSVRKSSLHTVHIATWNVGRDRRIAENAVVNST